MNTIIATFYLSLNDADTVNARSGLFTVTSGKSTLTFSLPSHSGLKAGTHIIQARLLDETWHVDSITPTASAPAATTVNEPATPTDTLVNAMAKAEKVEPPTIKKTPTNNEGKPVEKPRAATPPTTRAPITPPAAVKRAAPITPPKNLRGRATSPSAPTSPATRAPVTPPAPPAAKRPAPITPPAKQPKRQSLGGFSTTQTDNAPASGSREPVMHTDEWDDSDVIPF